MKIFDCSNSDERPIHRGSGGPIENTIMRDLKKYAHEYGCEFTSDIGSADVIITNDVFTKEAEIYALDFGVPLVKRMDGVFFQDSLRARNESLNLAARQADLVIFISEFSRDAHSHLYGKYQALKNSTVILNWVDDSIFKFNDRRFIKHPTRFVSIATSWERPEKRLSAILDLAKANPTKEFHLIGYIPNFINLPNVFGYGYIEDEFQLCEVLEDMDAMICTAFRDAAPKTVAQAISCGLPVFYANSGGVPELVQHNGLGFGENDEHIFYSKIPKIDNLMYSAFIMFCEDYQETVQHMKPMTSRYRKVMKSYFDEIKGAVK